MEDYSHSGNKWWEVDLEQYKNLEEDEEESDDFIEDEKAAVKVAEEFKRLNEFWLNCQKTMTEEDFKVTVKEYVCPKENIKIENVKEDNVAMPSKELKRNEPKIKLEYFQCQFCDAQFVSKSALDEHCRKHQEEKSFPCESCSEVFQLKQDLRLHRQKHLNARDFTCDRCSKGFKSASQLNLHKDFVHAEIVPIKCTKCGKMFRKQASLDEHMRGHQRPGVAPFSSPQHKLIKREPNLSPQMKPLQKQFQAIKQTGHPGIKKNVLYHCGLFLCEQKFPNPALRDSHIKEHRNVGY